MDDIGAALSLLREKAKEALLSMRTARTLAGTGWRGTSQEAAYEALLEIDLLAQLAQARSELANLRSQLLARQAPAEVGHGQR